MARSFIDSTSAQASGYFSVVSNMTIGGVPYRAAICHKLTAALRPTIERLVKEGKAAIYDKPVRFVSGTPRTIGAEGRLPQRKEASVASPSSAIPPAVVGVRPMKKKKAQALGQEKKAKKSAPEYPQATESQVEETEL